MPIFFLIVGIMLIIVALNDKMSELGGLITEDFTGKPSFTAWVVAVFVVGSLGYIKAAKPIANALLVLIVVSMMLSNKGFFERFTKALKG